MLASLAAIAVIVIGGFFALRQVAVDEAERDTRERVQAEARLVETAGLRDGILRGDPEAVARLDDLVLGQIVSGSIVRVKLLGRAQAGRQGVHAGRGRATPVRAPRGRTGSLGAYRPLPSARVKSKATAPRAAASQPSESASSLQAWKLSANDASTSSRPGP